jgi:hypothetical protein
MGRPGLSETWQRRKGSWQTRGGRAEIPPTIASSIDARSIEKLSLRENCYAPTPTQATHPRGRMELGISLTFSDPPDAQPSQGSKGQQQLSNHRYNPLSTHAEGTTKISA